MFVWLSSRASSPRAPSPTARCTSAGRWRGRASCRPPTSSSTTETIPSLTRQCWPRTMWVDHDTKNRFCLLCAFHAQDATEIHLYSHDNSLLILERRAVENMITSIINIDNFKLSIWNSATNGITCILYNFLLIILLQFRRFHLRCWVSRLSWWCSSRKCSYRNIRRSCSWCEYFL